MDLQAPKRWAQMEKQKQKNIVKVRYCSLEKTNWSRDETPQDNDKGFWWI